jgi:hypothetical protein
MFGPESSLIVMVVIALAAVVLLRFARRRGRFFREPLAAVGR